MTRDSKRHGCQLRRPIRQQDKTYIHLDDIVDFVPAVIYEWLLDADSCSGHNPVELAQGLYGFLESSFKALFIRNVGLEIMARHTELLSQFQHGLQRCLSRVQNRYVASHLADILSYGIPNAHCAPGDDVRLSS